MCSMVDRSWLWSCHEVEFGWYDAHDQQQYHSAGLVKGVGKANEDKVCPACGQRKDGEEQAQHSRWHAAWAVAVHKAVLYSRHCQWLGSSRSHVWKISPSLQPEAWRACGYIFIILLVKIKKHCNRNPVTVTVTAVNLSKNKMAKSESGFPFTVRQLFFSMMAFLFILCIVRATLLSRLVDLFCFK